MVNSCDCKLLMATVSQFGNFFLPAAFNYSVFDRQLSSLSSVHVEFNSTNSSMQSIARRGGGVFLGEGAKTPIKVLKSSVYDTFSVLVSFIEHK